jgi:hypothetical protein
MHEERDEDGWNEEWVKDKGTAGRKKLWGWNKARGEQDRTQMVILVECVNAWSCGS